MIIFTVSIIRRSHGPGHGCGPLAEPAGAARSEPIDVYVCICVCVYVYIYIYIYVYICICI